MSTYYSTKGPFCPHCRYQHFADAPFYFDEDTDEMECENCGDWFGVRISTVTSWETGDEL